MLNVVGTFLLRAEDFQKALKKSTVLPCMINNKTTEKQPFIGILEQTTYWDVLFNCPRWNFAQKEKSRGGTLVTRAYVKESTYS